MSDENATNEETGADISGKLIAFTMPDHSKWGIPVMLVAKHRAKSTADDEGTDGETALAGTLKLFAEDEELAFDWAANSMGWPDLHPHLVQIDAGGFTEADFQDAFENDEDLEIADAPAAAEPQALSEAA
jgi:hypothetical protein